MQKPGTFVYNWRRAVSYLHLHTWYWVTYIYIRGIELLTSTYVALSYLHLHTWHLITYIYIRGI